MSKPRKAYDGVEVPCTDPVAYLMPYVMPRRCDSMIFFNFNLNLTNMEQFIRDHQEDMPGLAIYHAVFAIIVRCSALLPQVNRFVCNGRVFQRDQVRIAMNIKKSLSIDAAESIINPIFNKTASLKDVWQGCNEELEKALAELDNPENDVDKLCALLTKIPAWILRTFFRWVFWRDKKGKLPKIFVKAQPFHSGFYVTNVGSIGLPAIYHHLYELGTVSVFIALGKKETQISADRDGNIIRKKTMEMKLTMDDRICDGYTYSKAYRVIVKYFEHPELLLEGWKPEDGVIKG